MGKFIDIYCLNKRHTSIILDFLSDIEDIIEELEEDYENSSFYIVIEKIVEYHNAMGALVMKSNIPKQEWYLSLPNNIYWASIGYLSSLDEENEEKTVECCRKILSLVDVTLDKLEMSLIIQKGDEYEEKINLN
tara:strand:+ start:3349 stop:3750 length:402 start_codon:yes stop_codon:yes gene_type:complete